MKALFALSLTLLLAGSAMIVSAQEHTKDSLDTVKKALAAKKAVLLDVREKSEWDAGHLKDARLLPLKDGYSSLLKSGFPKAEEK